MRFFVFLIALNILCGAAIAQGGKEAALREAVTRDMELKPRDLISLCDSKENQDWCEGYIAASITGLEQGGTLCLPTNEVGRYVYDGVWTIVKAWLYKQDSDRELTFREAISFSLTGTDDCQKD